MVVALFLVLYRLFTYVTYGYSCTAVFTFITAFLIPVSFDFLFCKRFYILFLSLVYPSLESDEEEHTLKSKMKRKRNWDDTPWSPKGTRLQ